MNSDTGQIYRGFEEISAAKLRGEPIVPVSESVAKQVETGQRVLNRRERRTKARKELRQAKKTARTNFRTKQTA